MFNSVRAYKVYKMNLIAQAAAVAAQWTHVRHQACSSSMIQLIKPISKNELRTVVVCLAITQLVKA